MTITYYQNDKLNFKIERIFYMTNKKEGLKKILCTNNEGAKFLIVNLNVMKLLSKATAMVYSKLIDLESADKFILKDTSEEGDYIVFSVAHSFLAKSVGISKSTVVRSLNYLYALNLVGWKSGVSERKQNVYVLNHNNAKKYFLYCEERLPFSESYFKKEMGSKKGNKG